MMINEDAIKYIFALAKCSTDIDAASKLVEAKIKEIVNEEVDACLSIVDEQTKEWGETAVRVNFITGQISKKIQERKG